ncbi:MAG: hypothetical protein AB2718_05530 [Candidatus Thiodiazotropha taylori]|nr:hypothetical protein [Candidatus Thiodiazotropha taylori]
METISENEAFFLVAMNASEESSLKELRWEFERWICEGFNVTNIIKALINDGTLLLSEREEEGFHDYSKEDSLTLSESWSSSESWNTILYLTDAGYRRWETDDWGITTKRAQHLMYCNQGNIRRVK